MKKVILAVLMVVALVSVASAETATFIPPPVTTALIGDGSVCYVFPAGAVDALGVNTAVATVYPDGHISAVIMDVRGNATQYFRYISEVRPGDSWLIETSWDNKTWSTVEVLPAKGNITTPAPNNPYHDPTPTAVIMRTVRNMELARKTGK